MEGVPGNRSGVGGIEIRSPIEVVWAWSPDDFVLFDLVGEGSLDGLFCFPTGAPGLPLPLPTCGRRLRQR